MSLANGPADASTSTSAAASSPSAAPPPIKKRSQKFSRSRTGCLACRKVKQRCDEQKPVCVRCVVAKKECTWPATVIQAASTSSSVSLVAQASPQAGPAAVTSLALPAQVAPPPPEVPAPGGYGPPHSTASLSPDGADLRPSQTTNSPLYSMPTDQLQLCFPSPEERSLMSHLLNSGASLSQSIPSHLPILFLHPAQLVASPRGLSIPSDALLFSLLAIASTHQSSMHNLHRKGLMANLSSLADGPGGFPRQEHTQRSLSLTLPTSAHAQEAQDRTRLLAVHLSTTSHALLLSSIAMSGSATDTLISTALTLAIGSILAATREWKPNLELARRLLEMRGGPAKMLAETRAAMERGESDGSALMRVRAMLEYLVFLDICACIGTGRTPTMIEPFSSWWFDFASVGQGPPGQAILDPSQAPSDWETVETTLGVSRGLIELLNRTVVLVGQCIDPQASVGYHPAPPVSFEERFGRAQELLLELEIWKEDLEPGDMRRTLSRLQYGNVIYAHAIKILVLTDVLHVPHADPSVQESAFLGQQLLLESNLQNGQVVCLMWPALIFGCLQQSHDALGRNSTRAIVESMRDRCAWDVDAALDLLHHVWARRDIGETDPSWREYQRQKGLLFC